MFSICKTIEQVTKHTRNFGSVVGTQLHKNFGISTIHQIFSANTGVCPLPVKLLMVSSKARRTQRNIVLRVFFLTKKLPCAMGE